MMKPTKGVAKTVVVVVARDGRVPIREMMVMKQIAVPNVEAQWDHPWDQDAGAVKACRVDSAPLSTIAEMTTPAVNTTGMNTPIAMAGVVMDRAGSIDTANSHSARCTTRASRNSGSAEVMALDTAAAWRSAVADGIIVAGEVAADLVLHALVARRDSVASAADAVPPVGAHAVDSDIHVSAAVAGVIRSLDEAISSARRWHLVAAAAPTGVTRCGGMTSVATPIVVAITMPTMMFMIAVDEAPGAIGMTTTTTMTFVDKVATPTIMMMRTMMMTTMTVHRLAARAALKGAAPRRSELAAASVADRAEEAPVDSAALVVGVPASIAMATTAKRPPHAATARALKDAAVVDAAASAEDALRSIATAIPATMTTTTINHRSKSPRRLIRLKPKPFWVHDAATSRMEAAKPPRIPTCGVVLLRAPTDSLSPLRFAAPLVYPSSALWASFLPRNRLA